MSSIVLDANVLFMLLFAERLSTAATQLMSDALRSGMQVVAPHLLPYELTNAIRRHMRREGVAISDALATLESFLRLPIHFVSDDSLHKEALRLTDQFSLGGHDAHYVALAQRLQCDLWTADERVLRAISSRLPFVRFIGDYVGPPFQSPM